MGKRIVVKIGSQVLCGPDGTLNREVLSNLVSQLVALKTDGWQILLVSSGAVAAGSNLAADLTRVSDPVARKQVMAATGQVRLMEIYRELFAQHGMNTAQVLATKSDFQTRRHYLNMRGCVEALLTAGIVPVVNENDVVSITELMFTDNDELAGLLAGMVNARLLCLLSTVPGVYDGDPEDATTRLIDRLVSAGLAARARSEEDRRCVVVTITGEGRQVLRRLRPRVDRLHRQQLGHLGRRQLAELNELLFRARHP